MTKVCRGLSRWAVISLCGILAASAAQAQPSPAADDSTYDEAIVIGRRETHVRLMGLKDPNLAVILSVGLPGVGQYYVGEWQKGVAFLGGVAASLVAVGLAGDNLSLTVEDYDKLERGGNNDGVVDVDEFRQWEKDPRRDFNDLSTARKAIIFGGLGTALGLYVWNIVDAHSSAIEYNRRLYAELTGVRLGLGVDPHGVARWQLTFAF